MNNPKGNPKQYDLLIIGSGPAGLSASIYASRYRIKHLVLGSHLGGLMALAPMVENYPGFPRISGLELAKKMEAHAKGLGAEIMAANVTEIIRSGQNFMVKTLEGGTFECRTLIIASGMERQKLNIPGGEEYFGKGVSYCSTCDAAFFKEKVVAVVGGANAAVMSAVHLAEFCHKVYLVYRKRQLPAEPIWIERAENNAKIKIIYEANLTEIVGDGSKVIGAKLDKPWEGKNDLSLDGVFIEIGNVPGTGLVAGLGVEINEKKFIKVKTDMSTNISGLFAAGDIADVAGEFQQIIMATAEGARAALSVSKYLKEGRLR